MPSRQFPLFLATILSLFAWVGPAAVFGAEIVNDTWADGTRNNTNLPTESAWYAADTSTFTASTGALTGTVSGGSRSWWTYFTTTPTTPVSLAVGDTLKATLVFTPTGVNSTNTNTGFRVGLFNFSAGTRSTSDGTSPAGANVTGYLLNMNFGQLFGIDNPLQIRERTDVASTDLMGSSGDYTTLGAGGGLKNSAGFSSGVQYTLELSVTRQASAVEITAKFSNSSGWSVTHTATGSSPLVYSFDGFAIRPANSTQSATGFTFSRFKVEKLTAGPVPPTITEHPQNQTVEAGQSATFSVTAASSQAVNYQWSKGGTPLDGATSSTLTLPNVQAANAGSYTVVASNSLGTATSDPATLTVSAPSAPSITTHPQSRTVAAGQSATFSVDATGTAPLGYQWSKSNVPIPGATSSTLTLGSVQSSDAASYTVKVSNSIGFTISSAATLTVTTAATVQTPDFSLVGFAALDGTTTYPAVRRVGGTTGGAGGTRVQVTTPAQFRQHAESSATTIIEVMNDIDLSSTDVLPNSGGYPSDYRTGEVIVSSNKTIFSKNGSAIKRGSLRIGKGATGKQNVIIRNLKFRDLWVYDPSGNYDSYGWDYINIDSESHHVWVDHCDFDKVYDGMVDVKGGSDFVTVSWCIFSDQKKCSLVGHSDNNGSEDTGHLNVTFHHNWYKDVVDRMPRMRFGNAHVFNLFCENLLGNGIQSTTNAATLVENCYFKYPTSGSLPTRYENGGGSGWVKVSNSTILNKSGVNVQFIQRVPTGGFTFNAPFAGPTAPYSYTAHPASQVPTVVPAYAGTGKLGFVFWREEQFTAQELTNPAISGPDAVLTADGVDNLTKYALNIGARSSVPATLLPSMDTNGSGALVFNYRKSSTATDVVTIAEVSTDLVNWSSTNVSQQRVATGTLETWQATYTGPAATRLFFRLAVQR